MSANSKPNPQSHERTVVLTRILDAPRERVFKAWTEAEQLKRWFGPSIFTVPVCHVDLRPGGALRLCLRARDGQEYWMRGVYREIAAPERLEYSVEADDAQGIQRLEGLTRATLAAEGGKTKLEVHSAARGASPEAAAMLAGMERGWKQILDQLAAHVAQR